MTAQQCTPPQAALVAIDIAKNRHEVLIDPGPGMRRRRLTVLNTRAEHDRLVATFGRPRQAGDRRLRTDRELSPRSGASLDRGEFEARLISSMARPHSRGAAQRLGQERSQGRPGDPPHAQIGASTTCLTGWSAERSARAVEDPRHGLAGQDRAVASPADPLLAVVLSRGRAVPGNSQRLVPGAAERFQHRPSSLPCQEAFVEAAWEVVNRRVSRHACWPISTRRAVVPWHCRYGLIRRPLRCSGWFSPKAAT